MKIIIHGNQIQAVASFWLVLTRVLQKNGHTVSFLVPPAHPSDDPVWLERLHATGASVLFYPLSRKGINPLRDLQTVVYLRSILQIERPDVLFSSTIKAVIYGSFAAALAGYPAKRSRHVMITGLGYVFEENTMAKKMLSLAGSFLYRLAFQCAGVVYFQNEDDRKLFESRKLLPKNVQVQTTRGTGVDIHYFTPAPRVSERFVLKKVPAKKVVPTDSTKKMYFLFVGRLLYAKGVEEFCLAAQKVRTKCPHATFFILGAEEQGVGAYPIAAVNSWEQKGVVTYLGATSDIRSYIGEADVVVLPSWREGAPCALLEAMASARAVLATDVAGCREVVKHGENGFLVPAKDSAKLAEMMEKYSNNPEMVLHMGQAGRRIAEESFSATIVAEELMQFFEQPFN